MTAIARSYGVHLSMIGRLSVTTPEAPRYEASQFADPRPVQASGRVAESHGANASRRAKLRRVTICRELRHSDQTIKSEHVGTDRRQKVFVFV